MNDEIRTDEWVDARFHKPWRNRPVLCRMKDGRYRVLSWNNLYWVGQDGVRVDESANKVRYFYIFERFNENDILP